MLTSPRRGCGQGLSMPLFKETQSCPVAGKRAATAGLKGKEKNKGLSVQGGFAS